MWKKVDPNTRGVPIVNVISRLHNDLGITLRDKQNVGDVNQHSTDNFQNQNLFAGSGQGYQHGYEVFERGESPGQHNICFPNRLGTPKNNANDLDCHIELPNSFEKLLEKVDDSERKEDSGSTMEVDEDIVLETQNNEVTSSPLSWADLAEAEEEDHNKVGVEEQNNEGWRTIKKPKQSKSNSGKRKSDRSKRVCRPNKKYI
ncbi:hypothetical protein M5689_003466 [Euphorbia peplus]|nr:hypothetical protein M5689_003466 [Euphorbia peplus]